MSHPWCQIIKTIQIWTKDKKWGLVLTHSILHLNHLMSHSHRNKEWMQDNWKQQEIQLIQNSWAWSLQNLVYQTQILANELTSLSNLLLKNRNWLKHSMKEPIKNYKKNNKTTFSYRNRTSQVVHLQLIWMGPFMVWTPVWWHKTDRTQTTNNNCSNR